MVTLAQTMQLHYFQHISILGNSYFQNIMRLSNNDAFTMPVNDPPHPPHKAHPSLWNRLSYGNAVKLTHMLKRRKMMTHSHEISFHFCYVFLLTANVA